MRGHLGHVQAGDAGRVDSAQPRDDLHHHAQRQCCPGEPCYDGDDPQDERPIVGRRELVPQPGKAEGADRDQVGGHRNEPERQCKGGGEEHQCRGEADQPGASGHRGTPSTARTVWTSA